MSLGAAAIIDNLYGTNTSHRLGSTASVGTTATEIVVASPRRLSLIVQNLHASNTLYILPASEGVTSTKGIRIAAGGFRSFTLREDFILPSLSWWAVASASSTTLFVLEVISVD